MTLTGVIIFGGWGEKTSSPKFKREVKGCKYCQGLCLERKERNEVLAGVHWVPRGLVLQHVCRYMREIQERGKIVDASKREKNCWDDVPNK